MAAIPLSFKAHEHWAIDEKTLQKDSLPASVPVPTPKLSKPAPEVSEHTLK